MNQKLHLVSIVAIGAALSAFANLALAGDHGNTCSNASLDGVYGAQASGTRPSSPGGPLEAVIGIVIRHYDGHGGVTQVNNIKGAISGYVPDQPGSGTYQVNEDCSVVVNFQPAPGVFIEELLVIVDKGRELRGITVLPAALMVTSVSIKM